MITKITNKEELKKELEETLESFNSCYNFVFCSVDEEELYKSTCAKSVIEFISQNYSLQSIKDFFYKFAFYLESKYNKLAKEESDYLNSLNLKYGNWELRSLNCTDEENDKMINYMTRIKSINDFYAYIASILDKLVEGSK